jgi:hypothetical protein
MLNDILNSANLYADGLKKVVERRAQWQKKHEELKDHLKKIAGHLNKTAFYKQGFFVDTLHAFNEKMNGVCKEMTSVTFRSGDMPMQVSFHNSLGENMEYIEEGFRITFDPTVTGEVLILLTPHRSDLNETQPEPAMLAIIEEPGQFTMEMADEIINKGIQIAYYSSFTGIAERRQPNDHEKEVPAYKHNPIGFRRYETTEKIK